MFAKKCDICGSYFDDPEDIKESDQYNCIGFCSRYSCADFRKSNVLDCCPACMKSIQEHINELSGNIYLSDDVVKEFEEDKRKYQL